MAEIVEFKVKTPGLTWESTPVEDEKTCSDGRQADVHALRIANAYQREVRWQWAGTQQGHYVGPGTRQELRRRWQANAEAEKIKRAGTAIFD